VGPDNRVDVRPARPEEAEALLAPVIDVASVRARADDADDPQAKLGDAARALHAMVEEPPANVPAHVGAYIRARRREIAVEIAIDD
jgi:hypothetical protein